MPAEERRPAEKAAAVISILGSERASEVFRYLTENEVEQLSMEITRLPRLAEDELEDIAKDFYNCCVTEKVITGVWAAAGQEPDGPGEQGPENQSIQFYQKSGL